MTVHVRGILGTREVELRFENGELSGDEGAMRRVKAMIAAGVDTYIAGVGGGPASLDTELDAAALFDAALPGCDILEWPEIPTHDEDTIP